ncbi:hypothetical protein S40288_11595 [Stachybotrys chartarum IBT 40288]|nr:hypothetical protein S40288_11595 [Stachybotrys chartarum IBT 40288]
MGPGRSKDGHDEWGTRGTHRGGCPARDRCSRVGARCRASCTTWVRYRWGQGPAERASYGYSYSSRSKKPRAARTQCTLSTTRLTILKSRYVTTAAKTPCLPAPKATPPPALWDTPARHGRSMREAHPPSPEVYKFRGAMCASISTAQTIFARTSSTVMPAPAAGGQHA